MAEDRQKQTDILNFWFGELKNSGDLAKEKTSNWFKKDPQWDQTIRQKFAGDVEKALSGQYDHWVENAFGSLALIVLLDQFTRNIFRNDSKAFTGDERALKTTKEGIEKGFDLELFPIQRLFFYLPLEHSEKIADQKTSLEKFNQLIADTPPEDRKVFEGFKEYAVKHFEVIKKFGRFPHRNSILGRESTADELDYLQSPGAGF